MARRPETISVGVAASERDVLLATKLYLPHLQPGFVPRPRLVDLLEDALAGGLVLVCAPAGFGKTALLGDWARRGGRAVAWLSLDAGDSDPARFWRHVVAALDRALPGIAVRVAPLLGPPAPPSFEGLVTALINELAAAPAEGELLLVLDDYHLIDSPPVHASLMFLLEHLPQGLHPVLASRADPPLALARLRARGQLAELRAAELRFTAGEAAALLREAAGAELPADALVALAARTEGWAAGLQLAGLSLRGQGDVAGFVATFSGSHRYVLDYLTEEVLERQTEQVRGFLLETSLLERLSGELCDAVTGRSDGRAMLEAIEAAGLFLVPLDEVRGWWRYHHLFADLLRARLQQQQPGRVPVLHRAAAAWHEKHGLANEAVGHALAAGDSILAARLIERHFDALFYLRGEGATVQRWLAALPAEVAGSRPRLLLAQALLALAAGRVEGVEAPLDAAGRAFTSMADEPFESTVGRESWLLNVPATVTTQRAYLAALRGDADGAASFASGALAEIGEDEWLVEGIARWNLALAEWLHGRLAEAERGFSSTISRWGALGERGLGAVMRDHLGQVQRARGRLDAAQGTYRRTLAITAPPGGPAMPPAGAGLVGLAEVAYERNELDMSLRHVTEGIPLCRQFVYTPPLAAGLATLAWIRQATGDPGGALEAMEEAGRAAPGPDVTVVLNPVPVRRARLQLAQGDLAAAARWTEQRRLSPGDEPGYPREPEYLVLARVLLCQDRPAEALALLERLHAGAAGQDRGGSLIEICALQALALAASRDNAAAVDALTEALTLACPQGYVRVFADEGAPMAALLGRLVAAQRAERAAARAVPLDYLVRLLRAFDGQHTEPGPGQAASAAAAGLVEPLTAREIEVLGLLAVGKSNPRIADELVITLDTVKKHVGHILDKLGAANRTEAVTRGQQLGLIN
jgi:LuxR family transcriptional regulator, maltose regulon positive regulatory protein